MDEVNDPAMEKTGRGIFHGGWALHKSTKSPEPQSTARPHGWKESTPALSVMKVPPLLIVIVTLPAPSTCSVTA